MNLEELLSADPRPAVLNVEEARSGIFEGKIGRRQFYAAIERGEIPAIRCGRRVLIPVPALLAILGVTREEDGSAASSTDTHHTRVNPAVAQTSSWPARERT
jgi:excisionase family DNA binding protein